MGESFTLTGQRPDWSVWELQGHLGDQGGPSSQTPTPKLSPVAPLPWRYPNTQPQVGVEAGSAVSARPPPVSGGG